MFVHSFDHMSLSVAHLEQSIDWYHKVFGFEVVARGARDAGPWAIIRAGEAMLCMYQEPGKKKPAHISRPESRHVIYHWGIRITDRHAWLETGAENDINLEFGGENVYTHSSSWYVSDPTGYVIEVALWKDNLIRFGA